MKAKMFVGQNIIPIKDKIKSKKTRLQSEGVEDIDNNEMYYQESGGFDAKRRVYGFGKAAPRIWEDHRHSTGGNNARPTPTPLTPITPFTTV